MPVSPGGSSGIALAATGGLGRRECAPHGDLDLILVHADDRSVDEIAPRLWYPIWDSGLALDHAVRTVSGALDLASADVAVALGLLDLRHLAGDAALTARLRGAALDQWRTLARTLLPALHEAAAERCRVHGELAFLLEGDLKQAAGGLRDVTVLRAIGRAGVAGGVRPPVRAAHTRLLDVRDALHLVTGRRIDRIPAQERMPVAGLLGLADGDALLRRVAQDARTVGYALDDAWRAVDRWYGGRASGLGGAGPRGICPTRSGGPARRDGGAQWGGGASGGAQWGGGAVSGGSTGPGRGGAVRVPIGRDVVAQDGEAVLARTAVTPRPDPGLAVRVAAAAATAGLPIARPTLEWLASFCPAPAPPWPAAARDALLTLLGSGPALVPTWEACDRYGLVGGWLPEWRRLRGLPQHNPVHRFTVDRHLVQTAAEAAAYARQVTRPDLLVLAALLHDVGKGLPGDHSVTGAPIARSVAAAIGLPDGDADLVARLVRWHLLLPEMATRRDVADPVTIRTVAAAAGDVATLELLHALTRADAAATGPGAWSTWKERLVRSLVDAVRSTLDTGRVPEPPRPDPALVAGDLPAVHVTEERVAVAAMDRRGLLATVAGCLALHRLDVVTADVSTVDGRTLVRCAVHSRFGGPPGPAVLAADLRQAVRGELADRLRRLAAATSAADVARVVWHRTAATDAAVLELRAPDRRGLLYRVARALDEVGAQVRAARIATLGGGVVDAFYLAGSWPSATGRAEVTAAVLAAV